MSTPGPVLSREQRLALSLGGGNDGFQAREVAAWLVARGATDWSLQVLIERLGEQLLAMGAPIYRMRLSLRTLHPQVTARSGVWVRGRAVAMIRVGHENEVTDAFIGSPIAHVVQTHTPLRRRLDALDPDADHLVLHEIRDEGGTDYLGLPVIVGSRLVGVVSLVSDRDGGFSPGDVEQLEALVQVLTPFLEAIAMRDIAHSLLDTYLGPRTGARVLGGRVRRGEGEQIDAVIWFSDLRDFTSLTERLEPERLLGMLNAYFELVAAAVTARGGEILRFIGDAMLIVFPVSGTTVPGACDAALESARDAYASLATLNHRRRRAGEPEIRFGVGLHVGSVIYGNVGAPDRLDFTVMGTAVNRTARLESLTKSLGTPLLTSAEFAAEVSAPTRSLGRHPMKGVEGTQEVFAVDDVL